MDFKNKIETNSGKIYAIGSQTPTNNYIEIGYYDENDIMIPLAAVEVKEKTITGNDINPIERVIYDLKSQDIFTVEEVRK